MEKLSQKSSKRPITQVKKMKIYQVGGSVRDMIRGQTPQDYDYVVTQGSIEEMLSLGYIQVGKSFPVFLHPQTKEEYALARKEIKTGSRHQDFQFIFSADVTLEEDLQRRDFTCNAIAYDDQTKTFIDPFGGKKDIENKILRHINSEHFQEDPLRILRLCRFAAQLDFDPAPETLKLAQKMTEAGMLSYLPAERIWKELEKALTFPNFDKFLCVARACGALQIILPEVEQLWHTPERTDYHPEANSGDHTLLTLKQIKSDNSLVRFALLLHDIGKTVTPENILPSHHNHEKNGLEIIRNICRRLKVPNHYRDFALFVCRNHMKFCKITEMRTATLVDFAEEIAHLTPKGIENYILACKADTFGNLAPYSEEKETVFKQNEKKLRSIIKIITSVKASDMPNFETLPKDERFKEKFRQYKINQVKKKL